MAAIDTSTRRVIAVITLMTLAAWALRGYVPGAPEPAERSEQVESNPAALAAVLVLLCAAVAIIGFAIVVRLRSPRPTRAPAGAIPPGSGPRARPSWRLALIALAAIVAWLLLVTLIGSLFDPGPVEPVAPAPSDTSEAPVTGSDAPPPAVEEDAPDTNVVDYLIPPMLILMALIVVGTALASRRQGRVDVQPVEASDGPAQSPAAATSLARAAEIGLAEIGDLRREPREAIIACYAAMERELRRVPGAVPLDCDTPTEVLARAVDSGALRADSATELVELFEEARFSPHVMTEAHRDAAVQVLNRVLAELPERV